MGRDNAFKRDDDNSAKSANYSSRRTAEPYKANAGKITPQLLYVEGVNREDVAYEVGLTGNLQDFMIRLNDGDESVASTFVVSANGFSITVDKVSDTSVDENNVPLKYDYTTRPWYQAAIREKKVTFTDIFVDLGGRGLALACAAPYYNFNGEIAGVVGEVTSLHQAIISYNREFFLVYCLLYTIQYQECIQKSSVYQHCLLPFLEKRKYLCFSKISSASCNEVKLSENSRLIPTRITFSSGCKN